MIYNNIYEELKKLYPDNPEKIKELSKDFKNWCLGKYPEPKNPEIKNILWQ